MHVQSNGGRRGGWLGGRLGGWVAGRPKPPPPGWRSSLLCAVFVSAMSGPGVLSRISRLRGCTPHGICPTLPTRLWPMHQTAMITDVILSTL